MAKRASFEYPFRLSLLERGLASGADGAADRVNERGVGHWYLIAKFGLGDKVVCGGISFRIAPQTLRIFHFRFSVRQVCRQLSEGFTEAPEGANAESIDWQSRGGIRWIGLADAYGNCRTKKKNSKP
jgi:hypothetical protein